MQLYNTTAGKGACMMMSVYASLHPQSPICLSESSVCISVDDSKGEIDGWGGGPPAEEFCRGASLASNRQKSPKQPLIANSLTPTLLFSSPAPFQRRLGSACRVRDPTDIGSRILQPGLNTYPRPKVLRADLHSRIPDQTILQQTKPAAIVAIRQGTNECRNNKTA